MEVRVGVGSGSDSYLGPGLRWDEGLPCRPGPEGSEGTGLGFVGRSPRVSRSWLSGDAYESRTPLDTPAGGRPEPLRTLLGLGTNSRPALTQDL